MDDMINKQDAIKAIRKCKFESDMPTDWYQGMETAQDIVNKVPSAETHDKRTETHGVCSDLISRQDAIDAIKCDIVVTGKQNAELVAETIGNFVDAIKSLPSAEPKTGEWIDIDNYYSMATCSHCHKVTMFEKWGEYIRPYNFCPNCGTKMYKGGEDE